MARHVQRPGPGSAGAPRRRGRRAATGAAPRADRGRVRGGQGQDEGEGAHDPEQHQHDAQGHQGRRALGGRRDVRGGGRGGASRPRRGRRRRRRPPGPGRPPAPKRASAGSGGTPADGARQQPAQGQQVGGREAREQRQGPQADGADARRAAGRGRGAGRRPCRPPATSTGRARRSRARRVDRGAQELARRSSRLPSAFGHPGGRRRRRRAGRWPRWRPAPCGPPWARARRRRGESGRPESVTAGEAAGRWRRPGRRRSAARRAAGAGRPGTGWPSERARRRARSARSAKWREPERTAGRCARRSRRGPGRRCASPGPSSTIAAVERERREAAQEPADAGVAHRVAVGRDEQVRALVARGRRRPGQAQHHGRGAGAGRHARRGVAGRQDDDAGQRPQPGGAGHHEVHVPERHALPARARHQVLDLHPARAAGHLRELPLHPLGGLEVGVRARRAVGRDGASWFERSSVPCPSMAEGSTGSVPVSGVSSVSSATTSATPATSQQVR